MKTKLGLILSLFILLTVACAGATQTTDTGVNIESQVDPNLYTLRLKIQEEPEGYSETGGSLYRYDTYTRGVVWQDGKGLVRGQLLEVSPNVPFASVGDTVIVKTTDRKVEALLPGDTITLYCVADYEPICAKNPDSNYAVGQCQDTWEFDFCRLDKIIPGTGR